MAIIGGIHHFQTYPHGPWWISSKLENWWKLKTPKSSNGFDPHIFPIPIAICSSMGDYKYHQFHIKLVIHPIVFQWFVGLVYHPTWSWHILWRFPKFLSHGTPKASILPPPHRVPRARGWAVSPGAVEFAAWRCTLSKRCKWNPKNDRKVSCFFDYYV